jgi:hypothetical protein
MQDATRRYFASFIPAGSSNGGGTVIFLARHFFCESSFENKNYQGPLYHFRKSRNRGCFDRQGDS